LTKRWTVALALAVTVGAGLAVRPLAGGAFGKYAGDALYATAVYWVLILVRPSARPSVAAVVATLICWAVELFQLTPVPRTLSSHSTLSRLVLGSTFGGWDLLAYPVGVLVAVAVHALLRRSLSRAPRTG
jgi:uncharacterized protein DUF2809